jgi:hypothetical protein
VTPSIPNSTAVPSDWRISAPAPLATARGATPKMNERGHQNRAKPRAGGVLGGLAGGDTALFSLMRELDD